MPYVLVEKQKAYQKEWSRKKYELLNKDGSPKQAVITWEELNKCNYVDDYKSWKECVTEAKQLSKTKHVDRILIGNLAIRACKIRHGGDYKTRAFTEGRYGKTLKEFASDIGVHRKTLWTWVQAAVLIKCIPEQENISIGLLHTAVRHAHDLESSKHDAYTMLLMNPDLKRYMECVRWLGTLSYSLSRLKYSNLTARQKESLHERLDKIVSFKKGFLRG